MQELTQGNIKTVPEKLGVYKIWVRTEKELPISIDRFCKSDKDGLLYIGRTKDQNLQIRLYQFYASAHPEMKTHNHSGAQKYFKRQIVRNKLGSHKLWFDYEANNNPKEREKELLEEYCKVFGEYPPLNK